MPTKIIIEVQDDNIYKVISTSPDVEFTVIGYNWDDEQHECPLTFHVSIPPTEVVNENQFTELAKEYERRNIEALAYQDKILSGLTFTPDNDVLDEDLDELP